MGHYITTKVDVDLADFDDDEIIEELQSRDYIVTKKPHQWVDDEVFALYQEWLADEGDNDRRFDKALRAFFSKMLNKNV